MDFLQAIMEVGEVLQFYDSDRHFPAWGFGGMLMDRSVSHCFNLNGSSYDEVFWFVQHLLLALELIFCNTCS